MFRTSVGHGHGLIVVEGRLERREVSPMYASTGTSVVILHELELVGWSFTLSLVARSKGPPELVRRVQKGGSEPKTQ